MHACLLTFLYICLHRRPNCPVITVNSNCPKSHTSCPLNFHQLYLVNFKFKIYLPGFGGSPLSSAPPSYRLPPKINKQTILLTRPISSCISTFPGVGGWLISFPTGLDLDWTGTELGNIIASHGILGLQMIAS